MSFLSCGLACILTSLAYAEFASRIPASGSAFTYVYVAFGEFYAWIVGWNLILGYGFTASVTARAWGDYTGDFLMKTFPKCKTVLEYLTELPLFGESVNYTCSPMATIIIFISTLILLRGAKDSSRFNNIMTATNLSLLALVVLSGLSSVSGDNLTPFAPYGVPGILRGAGLVFFAFIGFDMVASLSEEVINPSKNMPIGIVGSLIVSTMIYTAVSFVVVGMAAFRFLGTTVPVVNSILVNACCSHVEQIEALDVQDCLLNCQAFRKPTLHIVARIVSGGAIFGLTASCFTSLMGQPRIFYRMAQDGLWFQLFKQVDPETQVPTEGIKITGIATAFLACFIPLEDLANLISLGTLMVFTFVDAGVILLRLRNVAEASYVTKTHPHAKEESQRLFEKVHQNVVYLLVLFTLSLLGASLVLASSKNKSMVYLLTIFAVITAGLITYIPESWHVSSDAYSTHEHQTQNFNCPLVPIIPLAGVACNTFMMGSLPFSSWILCLIWLSCGIGVYFSYGIHHSVLGLKSRYSESAPLIEQGGMGVNSGGYDSTLNISLRPSGGSRASKLSLNEVS